MNLSRQRPDNLTPHLRGEPKVNMILGHFDLVVGNARINQLLRRLRRAHAVRNKVDRLAFKVLRVRRAADRRVVLRAPAGTGHGHIGADVLLQVRLRLIRGHACSGRRNVVGRLARAGPSAFFRQPLLGAPVWPVIDVPLLKRLRRSAASAPKAALFKVVRVVRRQGSLAVFLRPIAARIQIGGLVLNDAHDGLGLRQRRQGLELGSGLHSAKRGDGGVLLLHLRCVLTLPLQQGRHAVLVSQHPLDAPLLRHDPRRLVLKGVRLSGVLSDDVALGAIGFVGAHLGKILGLTKYLLVSLLLKLSQFHVVVGRGLPRLELRVGLFLVTLFEGGNHARRRV